MIRRTACGESPAHRRVIVPQRIEVPRMQLLPLHEVAYQIKPGLPLAWGIRDENGKLLLARGHLVADAAMLNPPLARGMFFDVSEMRAALGTSHASTRPKEGFFGRWR